MKEIKFTPLALGQFNEWKKNDKKTYLRINKLLYQIQNNPFKGIGKPEALKHQYKGFWSRRITDEHRLIYQVTNDAIVVIACKYHY